jgi:hypothetical protein
VRVGAPQFGSIADRSSPSEIVSDRRIEYRLRMSQRLNKAIAKLKELSPSEQDAAADAILDYVEQRGAPRLTPEQVAEVRASLAERLFLTDGETAALYRRYGV